MELRLHSHRWEWRAPDWTAAAVAGFAAGAVLMVMELLWAATMNEAGPWRISRLIVALVLGQDALHASGFNVGVVALALAIHYALGVLFGVLLATVVIGLHYEDDAGMVPTLGAVFGVLLYVLNFHVMTAALPWFAELRGWSTLIAHMVFGMVAALLYWKLARPGSGDLRSR